MSLRDEVEAARSKANATLIQLRQRLDIDDDKDLDADDIIAAVRRYEWLKIGLAVLVGFVAGALAF